MSVLAQFPSEKAKKLGITLDANQEEQLLRFAELVAADGITMGLSGRKTLEEILEKDILDSLLLVPLLDSAHHLLDIGSGAGFPGIVLKIALPTLSLTLLEAKQKALKFLESVKQTLNLDLEIVTGRAEESKNNPQLKARFDVVTGRAVAPLLRFLPWAVPYLKPSGKLILQKGSRWEAELNAAKPELAKFKLVVKSVLAGMQGDQKVLVLGKA